MGLTIYRRNAVMQPKIKRDYFNRANGALGSAWGTTSDAAPVIVSNQAAGSSAGSQQSARRLETYSGDHFSQVEATATPPLAGDFMGPAVRLSTDGQNGYFAIYFHDPSILEYRLDVYSRVTGTFSSISQSGAAPSAPGPTGFVLDGPLSAGDQIKLAAVGGVISLYLNGDRVIRATDTAIASGGVPGINIYGLATLQNWAGDNAVATPVAPATSYISAPPNSARNSVGGTAHPVRVLQPVTSALVDPTIPHNFLYMMPIAIDIDNEFGDPLETAYGLNLHNKYNLTIVIPGFGVAQDWMADHPSDHTIQLESWMVQDVVPWVKANFLQTGQEEHWIVGFSRTGMGTAGLILRNPTVFNRAAMWDWPFDMSDYTQYGAAQNYGTQASFSSKYQLSSTNLAVWAPPFQNDLRLWIGGYYAFLGDMVDADPGLYAYGIAHDYAPLIQRGHKWDSGWLGDAIQSLHLSRPTGLPINTAVPTLTGSLDEGVVLTSSRGRWTQAAIRFTYQWQTDASGTFVDIPGATAATYTTSSVDLGHRLRCGVLASNIFGPTFAPAYSDPTDPISAPGGPYVDSFNRADGVIGFGWTFFSFNGSRVDMQLQSHTVFGSPGAGDYRQEAYIADQYAQAAIESVPNAGDWVGLAVRIQSNTGGGDLYLAIYYHNGAQYELDLYVRQAGNYALLSSHVIGSTPLALGTVVKLQIIGITLTVSVSGTTVLTYTDSHAFFLSGVPGLLGNGVSAALGSWQSGWFAPTAPPSNVLLPPVSGNLADGGNVRAGTGGWIESPTSFAYQWQSDASGSFVNIVGQTSSVYTTVTGDTGHNVRCVVTATNGLGSASQASAAFGPIVAYTGPYADSFARANGSLGTGWTDFTDGGMAISSNTVKGTQLPSTNLTTGDYRTDAYRDDQFAQWQVATSPASTEWIGLAVRVQYSSGGQDMYLAIYFNNHGSYLLSMYQRHLGNYSILGTYVLGGTPLNAGDTLKLAIAGSALTLSLNGTVVVAASDSSLVGGAPGVIAFGTTAAVNAWSSG